ncbi:NAD(P)H-binding protein [Pedobacter sp. Du54]|uniref:NAD(P)H-binding protein n=1 Tax=Pedobacter anseongensis TaxID=3133439 RepID=UPI0030B17E82
MKALIIGATGATGKDLVDALLQDPYYTEVVIFVRRPVTLTHIKLTAIVTDFDQLEAVSHDISGDVLFSCLGTTLKVAGSKAKQRHIDFEIPLKFAQIAKTNGVSKAVLVSAYGASATSNMFYSRLKGDLENRIADLTFNQYFIFRPGLLLRKNTDRFGEKISARLLKLLNGLGMLRNYRPMPTAVLAEKLAKAPKLPVGGKRVVELDEIFRF